MKFIVAFLILSACGFVRADLVLSNLTFEPTGISSDFGPFNRFEISDTRWGAAQFTTGSVTLPGHEWSISEVSIYVPTVTGGGGTPDMDNSWNLSFEIREGGPDVFSVDPSDKSAANGATVGILNSEFADFTSAGVYRFLPTGTIRLLPDTTYFLTSVMTDPSLTIYWQFAVETEFDAGNNPVDSNVTTNFAGSPGWSMAARISDNNTPDLDPNGFATPSNFDQPVMFSINAGQVAPIPEPGAVVTLALIAALMLAGRRR